MEHGWADVDNELTRWRDIPRRPLSRDSRVAARFVEIMAIATSGRVMANFFRWGRGIWTFCYRRKRTMKV